MLDSAVSRDFIDRIDESQRALISKMVSEATFVAPALASFAMADLANDDALTGTYSANT
jgi:hypothetical protein